MFQHDFVSYLGKAYNSITYLQKNKQGNRCGDTDKSTQAIFNHQQMLNTYPS